MQHRSTYGSVQKIPAFVRAMSAVLTAIAICMGKWRGTTEVIMITHLSSSSWVVRSPFSSPIFNTYLHNNQEQSKADHAQISCQPEVPDDGARSYTSQMLVPGSNQCKHKQDQQSRDGFFAVR